MLRGLLTLAWLEIKIFVREPLGVIGTVGIPVIVFVALGRMFAPRPGRSGATAPDLMTIDLPILTAILIALSAVLSLVTAVVTARIYGIQVMGEFALAFAPTGIVWVLSSVREQPALVRALAPLAPRDPRATGLFAAVFGFSFVLTLTALAAGLVAQVAR